MPPKSIATNQAVVACDICGRTLLRGENADMFLHGGSRRTVCELCTSRAVHEGWIREGLDAVAGRAGAERGAGRTLLGRLRQRRSFDRDPEPGPAEEPAATGAPGAEHYDPATYDPEHYDPSVPVAPVVAPAAGEPMPTAGPVEGAYEPPREPRTVHAVPTNADLKVARALQVFNGGPHPKTVAGVSRSLGAPIVAARPSATEGSVVTIVVAWELSWYRYEVDLGDEASGVRVVAQGNELSELPAEDQAPNAAADDHGELHPADAV